MHLFQKIKYPLILVALAGILVSFTFVDSSPEPESKKDKVLIGVLRYILKNGHYEPKELNDTFSKAVYKDFIDEMDPIRRYFTQKDIEEFSKNETEIDDQLKREELTFFNEVLNRFKIRLDESSNYYKEILSNSFDFSKKEKININYDELKFAKNKNELIEYWRKEMKLNTLNRIQYLQEQEEDKLKLDSTNTYVKKTFEELEKIARDKTRESLDNFYERINDVDHNEWFSTFVNSIVEEFDPHTTYFAPRVKERFDINISGKIEGIGARLQEKNDYTKVIELIAGGPAWKEGTLEVGDLILKVAQAKEDAVDIVGMRIEDAIKLIKGKKGTEVILTVKKVDNSIQKISIIRDVVELEDTFVKSSIAIKNGRKYGIINLPKFYIDFNDLDGRDSASDMKREIEKLKKENIEGLLIDLRDNGGGSLKTAIEIGGLFIKRGPIVQVKYRDNYPSVRNDYDPDVTWDGPLAILVNELSASASEILAAAMQDYKRAVIIGSNQTYGKGTVQNVIPLNKYYKYDEDLGAVKLTIQKFYRINGGSTQLEGVKPDITMPSKFNYVKIGEKDQPNPLAWDKIPMAKYQPLFYYNNFDEVIRNSNKRIANNKEFNLINEYAHWLKDGQDKDYVSLQFKESVKEKEKLKNDIKKYKDVFKHESTLDFLSPTKNEVATKLDTILKAKTDAWHKQLKQDIYIDESLNVLSELQLKNSTLLAKK